MWAAKKFKNFVRSNTLAAGNSGKQVIYFYVLGVKYKHLC